MTSHKPRILAPAGDKNSFLAAVAAGADAIYCGLKIFSARMEADNFSIEELARLTSLAKTKNIEQRSDPFNFQAIFLNFNAFFNSNIFTIPDPVKAIKFIYIIRILANFVNYPFQAVYLTVAGWTLQQVLRFLALTVKTRCAQTVDGLNAPVIKNL